MFTRFDDIWWISGKRQKMSFQVMDTDHMLNIARMLYTRPSCIVKMMVQDIEGGRKSAGGHHPQSPWVKDWEDLTHESIRNITNMNVDEIVSYAFNSHLGLALQSELKRRGVCLSNYLSLLDGKANMPALVGDAEQDK